MFNTSFLMFVCSLTRLSMKKGLLVTFVHGQVIFKMTLMSMIPHGESESISKHFVINDQIYSYVISIIMCSLTLIVIIILIVGLLLGAIGFRRNTDPPDRTQISHYGGITILYW